jgi:transcriptional regulator with XRE-family HTH domain
MKSFGELLHIIRSRQNASQLVKEVGISYVYLLEKGARMAPKETVLLALADKLEFREGERELFFDLAAKERNSIPADVTEYVLEHKEIIEVVRALKNSSVEFEYLKKIKKIAEEASLNGR